MNKAPKDSGVMTDMSNTGPPAAVATSISNIGGMMSRSRRKKSAAPREPMQDEVATPHGRGYVDLVRVDAAGDIVRNDHIVNLPPGWSPMMQEKFWCRVHKSLGDVIWAAAEAVEAGGDDE